MKTYEDDIIASLTKAVRGIVEDVKYPHDMYKGDDVKTAKDPKEHKALADDGYTHEKPVDEVAEPKAKGEKEFKGKHKVKKSGEKEDGSVVKEAVRSHPKNNDSLSSSEYSKAKKNKNFSKDDWAWDNKVDLYKRVTNEDLDESADKKLVKKAVETALNMGGDMTGAVKKIEKMMKGLSKDKEVAAALQLANESIVVDDAMLDEAIQMNSLLEDKAKYKAFFDKALKKFGVDSPADLKGDKKKEFFDWVDANYEAENEED
tara:strand:- start:232 stop:1011 length:780 start_codon:yes stop_codon:yes gene_type:complete